MKKWVGKSLIGIGILHTIFGFVFFWGILAELAGEMFLNTIDRQLDRHAAFWFLFAGFVLMIVGGFIDWAERRDLRLPAFLKWSFLAITAMGCVIMPKSGFWLLIVPTLGLFRCGGETAYK
jgi:hypothetical protein